METLEIKLKVVGCGLPWTGTKSFVKALDLLGYKAKHNVNAKRVAGDFWDFVDEIDAVAEGIGVFLWKEIYEKFPDCKFILTTRSRDKWINKRTHKPKTSFDLDKHRTNWMNARVVQMWLSFGWEQKDKQKIGEFFDNHHREVREFFADKDNFMEMNILDGDGWDKLCPFLDKPIPDLPFPRVTRAAPTKKNGLVVNRLKERNKQRKPK